MIYTKDEIAFDSTDDFYIKVESVNAHTTTASSYRIRELFECPKDDSDKKILSNKWKPSTICFRMAGQMAIPKM